MTQSDYNWDVFGKRLKESRFLSLFYMVSGIILLILSGSHLQMKTLIMSVIYPILFGSLFGYIYHRYQTAIYKQEIGFWQAIASSDIVRIVVSLFRSIKWYSWLFYFLICLLLVVGVMIQLFIFLPPKATNFVTFMFLISSMLQIFGSFLFFVSLATENIIEKIRSTKK